jgi:hypothetical protein
MYNFKSTHYLEMRSIGSQVVQPRTTCTEQVNPADRPTGLDLRQKQAMANPVVAWLGFRGVQGV